MTQPSLHIGILETGRPPEELSNDFPDYPGMVRDWLDLPTAQISSWAVLDGELPDDPAACDLWVITGSRFGAYEGHPWIPPLEAFIRAVRDAGGKMFGICFGHQILAQALGGTVEKSAKGWGVGVHQYQPQNWPADLGPEPGNIALQAFHQDQVTTRPDGAQIVATSPFCENAALWYPGFALTFQAHPEYTASFARALIEARRAAVLGDGVADAGLAQVDAPMTRHDVVPMALTALARNRESGNNTP